MMRKRRIYSILVAVGAFTALTVLSGCRKQVDEPTPQPGNEPETEMVNVRFNTFLKEGDNVRPLNFSTQGAQNAAGAAGVGTRMIAGEGTLANGFYLYGHAHKLPFATSAGNVYTPIFENVKINAGGTYEIPKFWLQDKSLLYSFQAFAATDISSKEIAPGPITIASGAPYVSSIPALTFFKTTDILGAAVFDITIGDEVPTVNLYFEHRLAKLSLQMQRMNAGGPTLYNLRMKILDNTFAAFQTTTNLQWQPKGPTNGTTYNWMSNPSSAPITLPAGDMSPIEAFRWILLPRTLTSNLPEINLYYTLEPGAVSASNPEKYLTTRVDKTITLESGKQTNIVIGHMVETEQIVIQSVTLTDWSEQNKNVQEYN